LKKPQESSRTYQTTKRILRTAEVAAKLGVSRACLWRWYRSNHFPAPIILGHGATRPIHGWTEEAVDEWLASRPKVEPAA